MKWVWREFSKRQGDGYLHPARPLRKPVADPQGRAMTMLFFRALKIMCDVTLDRVSIASRKEVAEERERCANRARIDRAVAGALLESTPDQLNREDAHKLLAAAEVWDRLAQDYATGKHHVRNRGNALSRHVTGELVKACCIIFRKPMGRTVGTIAGVLLGVPDIPESTIRDWHPRG